MTWNCKILFAYHHWCEARSGCSLFPISSLKTWTVQCKTALGLNQGDVDQQRAEDWGNGSYGYPKRQGILKPTSLILSGSLLMSFKVMDLHSVLIHELILISSIQASAATACSSYALQNGPDSCKLGQFDASETLLRHETDCRCSKLNLMWVPSGKD